MSNASEATVIGSPRFARARREAFAIAAAQEAREEALADIALELEFQVVSYELTQRDFVPAGSQPLEMIGDVVC